MTDSFGVILSNRGQALQSSPLGKIGPQNNSPLIVAPLVVFFCPLFNDRYLFVGQILKPVPSAGSLSDKSKQPSNVKKRNATELINCKSNFITTSRQPSWFGEGYLSNVMLV